MISDKRGIGIGTLIIIIIVLLAAVPLFIFSGDLAKLIAGGSELEACRLSVIAQAKLKTAGKSPVSIECPRKSIVFYENRVEEYVQGKKTNIEVIVDGKRKDKFDELTDSIVKQVFAEELRECWYKVGEGDIDAFEEGMLFSKGRVCLICSTLGFDESVDSTKEFYNLPNYLKITKFTQGDEEISYYDYLSKDQEIKHFFIPFGDKDSLFYTDLDEINTATKYIVFMQAGKVSALDNLVDITKDTYFVIAGPSEIIGRDMCETLLN